MARQAIQTNAREVIDQSEWSERNGKYLNHCAEATKRLEELDKLKSERLGKSKMLEDFKTAHPGISTSSVMVIVAIRSMGWSLSLTKQRLCK